MADDKWAQFEVKPQVPQAQPAPSQPSVGNDRWNQFQTSQPPSQSAPSSPFDDPNPNPHALSSEGWRSPMPGLMGSLDELAHDATEGTVRGFQKAFRGGLPNAVGGASDAFRAAAPVVLAPFAAENPLMAIRALPGAMIGSKLAGMGAQAMGARPEYQQAAEDAGGILGGGMSNRKLTPSESIERPLRSFFGLPTRVSLEKPPVIGGNPNAPLVEIHHAPAPEFLDPDIINKWMASQPAPAPVITRIPRSPLWKGITITPRESYAPIESLPPEWPGRTAPLQGYEPDIETQVEGTPIVQKWNIRRSK